jgi:hypothetical protein
MRFKYWYDVVLKDQAGRVVYEGVLSKDGTTSNGSNGAPTWWNASVVHDLDGPLRYAVTTTTWNTHRARERGRVEATLYRPTELHGRLTELLGAADHRSHTELPRKPIPKGATIQAARP